jgi:hypothetical protein
MQNVKHIPEVLFSKGMDNKHKPEFLKEGFCELAQNCLVGEEKIVKGPGYTSLFNIGNNTRYLGGISTNSRIYTAFNNADNSKAFTYTTTGSGNPIVVAGSDATASLDTEYVDTGTAVYKMNGTNSTGKLVGTVYTTPAGIPTGKYGIWFNNRLYIMGNSSFPNRVYFSNINDPDTFSALDYIDIVPDSKDIITGVNSSGGVMIIFKRNKLFSFDGYTIDDFTIKSVAEEFPNYGATSHRSVINTGDDLLFMSFAGDIPAIRSLKRTSFDKFNYGGTISDNIEGTMNMLNKERLDIVAGGFDGRHAWWAVPYQTSTTNNYVLCYDIITKGWTVHTDWQASGWFRSSLVGGDRLYFGAANSISKVYQVSADATSKDGAAIDFQFISRAYRPQVSRKTKWKYMRLVTGSETNGDIDIYYSPDGFSYQLITTYSSLVSTGVFPITFPFRFGESQRNTQRVNLIGDPAYTYQLKFTESSVGTSVVFPLTFTTTFGTDTHLSINEYDLMYIPKPIR